MTLDVSWLRPEDREPGAVVAVADDTILSVRELSFDGPSGHAQLVLEGVGAGSTNVSIRQVDGDLLIDRTRVTVGAVSSVRLVAPGTVGCVRDAQVLLRSVEVAPVAELVASSGALLADESAHVLDADGGPVGPIAADVDRVSLLVVGGGARTPIELDVVDRADRIEQASAARHLLVAPSQWSSELFHCYRAVRGEREVVGAAFEFAQVTGESRVSVEGNESAPQCLFGYPPANAALHVRAAGAERVEGVE